jgi:hypothetical protein
MILTPLNIQIAIIKAWYSIALKSIKYYGGLAVGINNSCLLKEVRLLRAYVDILKNFEIVGDKTVCSCCIEGDYTVLLNDLSELTEAKIQFGCDNAGSMYYDNISYPFVYSYDSNNKKIVIQFSTLINPSTDDPYVLNLDDVNFTEDCSFEPGTVSPIEVAVIAEVTEIPVTADNIYGNWDGNITIYEDNGITVLHQRTISVDIIDDPQAIVDYWNTNGPEEWLLLYDGTQYTMLTPFDGTDYSDYTVVFSQYEGGQDSLAPRTSFIPQVFVPVGTRASTIINIPNTFVGSIPATSTIQPAIPQPFITEPTLATAELVIPDTIFSTVQTPATMTIVIKDVAMFGTVNPTNQFFTYNSNLMFSHVGAYADPAALVSGFNSSNTNGFTMSYVGPSPTTSGLSIFEIESPISGQPFNDGIINIIYIGAVSNQPVSGTFSGGTSIKPLSLTISDDFGLAYDVTSPSFSNVADFVTDFNNTVIGYTLTLGSTDPGFSYLIFTPSGPFTYDYNGTPLTFIATDPTFLDGTYSNSAEYQGGIDTTECTYTLKLYDTSNALILPIIENTTPTIYTSVADIAEDILENGNNTYRFGTGVNVNNEITTSFPYEFELPQSLICETYNGYYFSILIEYISSQYGEYISDNSTIGGGLNAVSKQYEINDTTPLLLYLVAADSYNYPNGSEIINGLIPAFNNDPSISYEAEYVEPGPDTPETPAIVINNFIIELTAAGISNGQEIIAEIDSIGTEIEFLGNYQAPITGGLPLYPAMITNLNNSIVSNNFVPGLDSISIGGSIIQESPPTQGGVFNGKLLRINKIVYTPATVELTFGIATFNTLFLLRVDSLIICGYLSIFFNNPDDVAILVENEINSSGTGYTATRVGPTVTISALPFTGESFNLFPLSLQVYSGSVVINSTTYSTNPSFDVASFTGGTTTPTLIKQVAFSGGVAPIPTTRVRFYTPEQPLTVPIYGTGNWAYNTVEELEYDYDSGEYLATGTYSGGIDPTVGQFTVELLDPLSVLQDTLYNDLFPQNYLSKQALVDSFNADPNNLDFQIVLPLVNNLNQFLSPPDSFDFFTNYIFRYSYDYVSPQYTDYEDIDTVFINGLDPVLTPYEGTFEEGNIGTFVNDNPCTPETVEQTCLSNKDVSKIIAHIDKLVR